MEKNNDEIEKLKEKPSSMTVSHREISDTIINEVIHSSKQGRSRVLLRH
jgi:hypothetical protein